MRIVLTLIVSSLLAKNVYSMDDLPLSVREIMEMKDQKSIQYEIRSYEAAIDLKNLAENYYKSGFSEKALKYATLASHLFPYRTDLVSLKVRLINDFVEKTNYAKKDLQCDDYNDRVNFIKKISPDSILKIQKNDKCQNSEEIYSIKDIKYNIKEFIAIKPPKIPLNHPVATGSLYDSLEKTIHKNTNVDYPLYEQLYLGLSFLGGFKVVSTSLEIDKLTSSKKNVALKGSYDVFWREGSITYQKFCESISLELSRFPTRKIGSTNCSSKEIIPYTTTSSSSKAFSLRKLNIQEQVDFVMNPLPRHLFFRMSFVDKSGNAFKWEDISIQTNSIDPTGWLEFSSFREDGFDPYSLKNNASFLSKGKVSKLASDLRFDFFDEFLIKIKNPEDLKKLDHITFEYLPDVTHKKFMSSFENFKKRNFKGSISL